VVYVCQWEWWVVFVFINLILLVTASAGAFLRSQCASPDILGYVSSMTRDSPFIRLPPGGCALDGMDRTRLLKSLKVQLRDVREGGQVGQIAFTSQETESGPLVKNRQYS
jgi:hypothetical protein